MTWFFQIQMDYRIDTENPETNYVIRKSTLYSLNLIKQMLQYGLHTILMFFKRQNANFPKVYRWSPSYEIYMFSNNAVM